MFKPHPLNPKNNNFLFKQKSEQKSISKTMRVLFIFVFITFSLNFGAVSFKSSKVKYLIDALCVIKTLGLGFYLFSFYIMPLEDPVMMFWNSTYIVEFFVLVFTLLFSRRSTFVDFYKDLLAIDVKLGKDYYRAEFIIITGITICTSYRCLLSVVYCVCFDDYCVSPMFALVIFDLILVSSDVFIIVHFVIYYSLYCRIKNFTALMKKRKSNVVSNHFLYKAISDVYDRVKVLYNPLFVLPLVFHTVDMMITIFYPLLLMDQTRTSLLSVLTANISVFQVFILLFAPAFASGLLASQVEKLRVVLLDRLLHEREEKYTRDLERFINYIEVRSMKTVIFKVIPLDWKLPVSVLNICVTYLIVMLQFTHKY